jgi:drug/metabolite transporter (DMT)-like permease
MFNLEKMNVTKGVTLSIFAALLFSIMAALDKLIANKTSIFVILFLQSASALILTILYGFPKLKYELFKTNKINFYCIRGLLGVFGVFGCLFLSLKSLSITDGIVLNATSPLFMPLFLFLTYHLKVSFKALLFMLVGFSGVILTIQPDGHMMNTAGFLALLSGACTAIIIVILKILAKNEPIERMAFYYCLISTLCSGSLLLYNCPETSIP